MKLEVEVSPFGPQKNDAERMPSTTGECSVLTVRCAMAHKRSSSFWLPVSEAILARSTARLGRHIASVAVRSGLPRAILPCRARRGADCKTLRRVAECERFGRETSTHGIRAAAYRLKPRVKLEVEETPFGAQKKQILIAL